MHIFPPLMSLCVSLLDKNPSRCNIMVAPPFYNTYYGKKPNCYDLCNVWYKPVVYSIGPCKTGEQPMILQVSVLNIIISDSEVLSSVLFETSWDPSEHLKCIYEMIVYFISALNVVLQKKTIHRSRFWSGLRGSWSCKDVVLKQRS